MICNDKSVSFPFFLFWVNPIFVAETFVSYTNGCHNPKKQYSLELDKLVIELKLFFITALGCLVWTWETRVTLKWLVLASITSHTKVYFSRTTHDCRWTCPNVFELEGISLTEVASLKATLLPLTRWAGHHRVNFFRRFFIIELCSRSVGRGIPGGVGPGGSFFLEGRISVVDPPSIWCR